MADSYSNFFHIIQHKLSECLLESDLLLHSDHRSEDDKQS
jgi:hypothetical protein